MVFEGKQTYNGRTKIVLTRLDGRRLGTPIVVRGCFGGVKDRIDNLRRVRAPRAIRVELTRTTTTGRALGFDVPDDDRWIVTDGHGGYTIFTVHSALVPAEVVRSMNNGWEYTARAIYPRSKGAKK